jgi:hypothetical protein
MKSPSTNISRSLRGQGKDSDAPRVSGQKTESAGSRVIPGESGIEDAPGNSPAKDLKAHAGALGGHFGGRK